MGLPLIFPFPDRVKAAATTLYGPDDRYANFVTTNIFTPAATPLSHAANADLSQIYRVASVFRGKSFLEVDMGSAVAVDGIALLGCNFSSAATVRVTISDEGGAGDAYPHYQLLKPNGLVSSSNYTGADVADVDDDPDNPDANNLVATSTAADTFIWMNMGNPVRTLLTASGTDRQIFRVLGGLQGGAGSQDLDVWLYESGGFIRDLGSLTVTREVADGGSVGSFTWDAAEIAGAGGANVEMRLIGRSSGSVVPVVMAALWYAALGRAGLGTIVHDTGDLAIFPTIADFDNLALPKNGYIPLSSAKTGQWVRIEVDDPNNPDGQIDFGRVLVGTAINTGLALSRGQAYGPSHGVDLSAARVTTSDSGQEFAEVGPLPREIPYQFAAFTKAEADAFLDELFTRVGVVGEVVVIPDRAATPAANWYRSLYGRLVGNPTTTPVSVGDGAGTGNRLWNVGFTLRERLSL